VAGLKELKNRLSTVNQTEVMTSAMKMVSASKLRKAQSALYKAKAFAVNVSDVYGRAGGELNVGQLPVSTSVTPVIANVAKQSTKKVLIVVLTSNKGLCGSFNVSVCKEAEKRYKQYTNAELLCIGAKGYEYFNARKYPVCKEHDSRTEFRTYSEIAALSRSLSEWYNKGRYDKIEVVYSHPVNAMSTERRTVSLLPLQQVDFSAGKKTVQDIDTAIKGINIDNILFFPSRVEVAETIVPLMVASLLYFFMMESSVAEHGARMTAMSQATDNAQTLGRELNLTYNKLRQQAITNELLEIIAGANAL
jgi:F-type H+-transporting ATPase subunit gamma